MAARRINHPNASQSNLPPATTPEGREDQLAALSYNLAERQLRDGTASAQVMTHFLKMGSTREKLEKAKMAHEVELLKVKAEMMESAKEVEKMYGEAMRAFKSYSGQEPDPSEEELRD